MRCLTLADKLRERGGHVCFVCRELPGNLFGLVQERGYSLFCLPPPEGKLSGLTWNRHAKWLSVPLEVDARETVTALGRSFQQIDWLVVDHYALNREWESILRPQVGKIMVIDDLADRPHDCELLLDQTYGRKKMDYLSNVPSGCLLLLGSRYALLRPQFSDRRYQSLRRRAEITAINSIFVCMGGIDPDNVTGLVLQGLEKVVWPTLPVINVVLNDIAPHLDDVRHFAAESFLDIRVFSNVLNMAELMLEADLAIGAGGTTSWERCALGLPSLIITTADNQEIIAKFLHEEGAARCIGNSKNVDQLEIEGKVSMFVRNHTLLQEMSKSASNICDGKGTERVIKVLMQW